MKTDTFIINRLGNIGHDGWMHVCPLGDHPWTSADGKETVIQVIDREACEAMARQYPLSIEDSMIDWEHKSMGNTDDTDAAGWGKEAQVRADGLWVRCEWSDTGRVAIEGKRYKFNSPCFARDGLVDLGGGRYRITKLGRIALTNNPNLRGQQPLTNSRSNAANPNQSKNTMELKTTLLTLLGLAAEATDQEVVDAITALKTGATEVEAMGNRVSELETQIANSDLDGHGITDAAQRAMFAPLLTNATTRPAALATLAGLKAKPAPATIHNRNSQTPAKPAALANAEADAKAEAVKAAWIGNRASAISRADNRPFPAAFAQATAEWEHRTK